VISISAIDVDVDGSDSIDVGHYKAKTSGDNFNFLNF